MGADGTASAHGGPAPTGAAPVVGGRDCRGRRVARWSRTVVRGHGRRSRWSPATVVAVGACGRRGRDGRDRRRRSHRSIGDGIVSAAAPSSAPMVRRAPMGRRRASARGRRTQLAARSGRARLPGASDQPPGRGRIRTARRVRRHLLAGRWPATSVGSSRDEAGRRSGRRLEAGNGRARRSASGGDRLRREAVRDVPIRTRLPVTSPRAWTSAKQRSPAVVRIDLRRPGQGGNSAAKVVSTETTLRRCVDCAEPFEPAGCSRVRSPKPVRHAPDSTSNPAGSGIPRLCIAR